MFPEQSLMQECQKARVNGFIVVDLPPEEAIRFRNLAQQFEYININTTLISSSLSYIPLIAPSTSENRIAQLVKVANSFIYVVSTLGVTGARVSVNSELPDYIKRIKRHTEIPLAVGFGVSTRQHFLQVGAAAEGVVIGSKIISVMKEAGSISAYFYIKLI